MKPTVLRWLAIVCLFVLASAGTTWAQGTTGAITGTVVDDTGEPMPGVNVIAVHQPTGTRYGSATNQNGRYTILSMRVGGPYTVRASFVGYQTVERRGITIDLNEKQVIDFTLQPKTEELEGIEVIAQRDRVINEKRTGAGANVSQEQIEALPTISRSLTDYARLVPQYQGNGSFGGLNDRYNSIQIDGATLDDVFGLGEAVPGSQAGTQPISLDAIEEFNIDIAPFDVRSSGFTGGQINAITKSGTNQFEGSLRYMGRDERLTGDLLGEGAGEFQEQFVVATLGGPIIEDELFFFVSGEIVRQDNPLETQVGQGVNAFSVDQDVLSSYADPFQNTREAIDAIQSAAQEVYNYNPGGIEPLSLDENSNKLLVKLDWNVNQDHKLTLRHNYVKGTDETGIGRGETGFDLSNRRWIFESVQHSSVVQLNSTFGTNMFNEARLVSTFIRDERDVQDALFPETEIRFTNDRSVFMGIDRFSQANRLGQDLIEITDNFEYVTGNHTITVGTNNKIWSFSNLFIQDFAGQYRFESFTRGEQTISPVEAFRRGQPTLYRFSVASSYVFDEQGRLVYEPLASGDIAPAREPATNAKPDAEFTALQFGLYVQDEWEVIPGLNLTAGLRIDMPYFPEEPTDNPLVSGTEAVVQRQGQPDSTFAVEPAFGEGVSTSNVASGNLLWSPRVGFNYNTALLPDLSTQIRGGVGLFAGNPPFVWISNQFSNTGADFTRIDASFTPGEDFYGDDAADDGGTPGERFVPTGIGETPTDQPLPGEGNALTPVQTTEINLISDDYKYPQVFRANVAVDQELPKDFVFTLEGLYSKTVNDITYRNLNIEQVGTSKYGRPIYGDRINPNFTNALLLENTNKGYQWSATVQVQRRVDEGLSGSIAYTYSDARNVNNGTSSRAISNWQFNENKDVNDPRLGRSDFVRRHRIVGDLTYRFSWMDRFATSIGLIYEGQSGQPFSYIYNGNANSDTRSDNDLVYVPETPTDVVLTTDNWEQLDAFIESEDGLDQARGEVVRRNTGTQPWQNILDLNLTQEIATFNGQRVEIIANLENVLNRLNDDWGDIRTVSFNNMQVWGFDRYVQQSDVGTELGGRVITADDVGKPVINFDESTVNEKLTGERFFFLNIASRWRFQLGARYIF